MSSERIEAFESFRLPDHVSLNQEDNAVTDDDDSQPVALNVSLEMAQNIISNARMFDVKADSVEPDPGSSPIDMKDREVSRDYPERATAAELREAIDDLHDDEVST